MNRGQQPMDSEQCHGSDQQAWADYSEEGLSCDGQAPDTKGRALTPDRSLTPGRRLTPPAVGSSTSLCAVRNPHRFLSFLSP